MIACITIVLGVMSFSKLGLDMLPDIEFPVVSVITNYQGVASEDIEEIITKPIEDSVATVKSIAGRMLILPRRICGIRSV
jgi:HAE1 family hydrophobic/amphiphilic exporter-1